MSTLYRCYYDSVDPDQLPAGAAGAVYINGLYAAAPGQVEHLCAVLWIDVLATRPEANLLDVERGDATPSDVPGWVRRHVDADGGPERALSRIYCNRSTWPACRVAAANLPYEYRKTLRWSIADPTGAEHLVAGSDSTQFRWGATYDANVCTERFWPSLWTWDCADTTAF